MVQYLFLIRFFTVSAIQDRDLVHVMAENMFDCVHFGLFAQSVEVIRVGSVKEVSNGSHLMLVWMARVPRNNAICMPTLNLPKFRSLERCAYLSIRVSNIQLKFDMKFLDDRRVEWDEETGQTLVA